MNLLSEKRFNSFYHWILLKIKPKYGRVEVFDSLKKDLDQYQSIIDMLQR
jgi:hypothetical protein